MPSLHHVTTIAHAPATCSPANHAELDSWLARWRTRNAECGVTGFLLCHDASFVCVLDGFSDLVESMFAALIHAPPRHLITPIVSRRRAHPSFGPWSRGIARISPSELVATPGLAHFITGKQPDCALDVWRAGDLLVALRSGRGSPCATNQGELREILMRSSN